MKKIFSLGFALIMIVTLVACDEQIPQEYETVTIYSYSGENEQYSIINGIIMLSEEQDIIYGGEFREKGEPLTNVVFETMGLYVLSDNEKISLTSFSSSESGGDGFSLGNPGSGTGVPETAKESILNNLYFELSIETLSGEKTVSDIKMNVVDVTGIFED